ncbi:MAG: hypothetical protein LBB39_02480 [Mycoplasmataceae bacterium]|nr:hypothetical protein [Mycoplasmataceae bacterium]
MTLDNCIDIIIKGGWSDTFCNESDEVQEKLLNSYITSITRIEKQIDSMNNINSSKLISSLSSLSRFIGIN